MLDANRGLAPSELSGVFLHELAHAHWLLAWELEYGVGQAVDPALSVKFGQHSKVADQVFGHTQLTKLLRPCLDRYVAVTDRAAESFGESARIVIQIGRLGR